MNVQNQTKQNNLHISRLLGLVRYSMAQTYTLDPSTVSKRNYAINRTNCATTLAIPKVGAAKLCSRRSTVL
uniref:Uncharacterized protein n=1 Tax=Anguilla anguilla TaxID=7936 RepID=A0A0E9WZF8_ANGAN